MLGILCLSAVVAAGDEEERQLFADDTVELYLNADRTLTVKGIVAQGQAKLKIHLFNPYAAEEFDNPFEGEVSYDVTLLPDGTFEYRTDPVNFKTVGILSFEDERGSEFHEAIRFSMMPLDIPDYQYKDYQKEALSYLNTIRKAAGLREVKMNGYITEAATNHANYIVINDTTGTGLAIHDEDSAKKGFTGSSVADRLRYLGLRESVSEIVVPYGMDTAQQAIDLWLTTAYHRAPLMNPRAEEFGIAIIEGTAVLNMVQRPGAEEVSVYPYDGMKDVGLDFTGNEIPNPLEKFDLDRSGFIISFQHPSGAEIQQATIKNSNGDSIPFYMEATSTLFLYPAFALNYDDTYTVSLDYTVDGKRENKTWSFHTIKEPDYNKNNIRVNINGKMTAPLYPKVALEGGRTYVPLRGVLERLNAKLTWDAPSNSALIRTESSSVKVTIGSKKAIVNGREIVMDAAPFIRNERTFVPLRFISEAIGADVKWDEAQRVVFIQAKLGQPEDLTTYLTDKMEGRFKSVRKAGEKYGYIADNTWVENGWYTLKKASYAGTLFFDSTRSDIGNPKNSIQMLRDYTDTIDPLAFTVIKEVIELQTGADFEGLDDMLRELFHNKQNAEGTVERQGVSLNYTFEASPDAGQLSLRLEYVQLIKD